MTVICMVIVAHIDVHNARVRVWYVLEALLVCAIRVNRRTIITPLPHRVLLIVP